jgi:hypothetical protein
MKKINLINQDQIDLLKSKNWKVYPNLEYLTLYKKDFYFKYWKAVCDKLNISTDENSVHILYVGTQINLEN